MKSCNTLIILLIIVLVAGCGASNHASVTPKTLVSIAVTPANPSIGLGTSKQLTATGTFSDGSTQDLTASATWSSSNTIAATIASSGIATAVATGTTTIKATSGSISGSTLLTVTSATLVSIAVTPANPSITLGATEQFTATGTFSDSSHQDITTSVTWSSLNPSVATISNIIGSNGKATPVATTGSTTIAATSGSISGFTTLTITTNYSTYPVGVNPSGLAVDSSGNIWVTDFGSNSLLELIPGGTTTTYSYNGDSPSGIAIDYVGNFWLANYNYINSTIINTGFTYTITMINLNQPAYDATKCPTAPTNTSGGVWFYTFPAGGAGPHGIAIDASSNVWVTNYGTATAPGNTVTKFLLNYTFCSVSAQHPAIVNLAGTVSYTVGSNPYGIAIDSQGNAWVSNYGSNTVSEIIGSSGLVNGPFPVGTGPQGIAIDPSGNVWVANTGSDAAPGNTVTKLSPTGALLGTFTVGSEPSSIAIETSGNVWVTNSGSTTVPGNTITELNYSGTVLNTLNVRNNPTSVVIDFAGNLWVANYYDDTVTFVKGATSGTHFSPYNGPIWP